MPCTSRMISRAVPLAVPVVAAFAVTAGATGTKPALADDVIPGVTLPPLPPVPELPAALAPTIQLPAALAPVTELPADPGSLTHQPSPAGPGSAGMPDTDVCATVTDPAATPVALTTPTTKAVARTTPATVAVEAANTSTSERESSLPFTGVAAALVLAVTGGDSLGSGTPVQRLAQH